MTTYLFTIAVINRTGFEYNVRSEFHGKKRRPFFRKSLRFDATDLGDALDMLDQHCMGTMKFDEYHILYCYAEKGNPFKPLDIPNIKSTQ